MVAKTYTEAFKRQIVSLSNSGKSTREISAEYGMAPSTVAKWVKDYNNSGSFSVKDNRSPEEKEMIKLRKENKQLRMENDILKQAALIMGRK